MRFLPLSVDSARFAVADDIDPERQLRAAGKVITMLDKRVTELEAEVQRLSAELATLERWGVDRGDRQ